MEFFMILEDHSEEVQISIIRETSNSALLEYATCSENPKLRAAVALNINASEWQLKLLSTDPDIEVRKAVLQNKDKTSGDIIDAMLKDDEVFEYENLIINHPNVYKKTLERYVKYHKDGSLKIKAQQRLRYM